MTFYVNKSYPTRPTTQGRSKPKRKKPSKQYLGWLCEQVNNKKEDK